MTSAAIWATHRGACLSLWSHLDEPCDDLAAPMLCGQWEEERDREHHGALASDPDPINYIG